MLTPNQEGYLTTIPTGKIAHIHPFDPAVQIVAQEIIGEIADLCPIAPVYYIGSSKLGIAGENDIDLTVLGEEGFEGCLDVLERNYGTPVVRNLAQKYAKWEFVRGGFPVELHLGGFMDANLQEQIDSCLILEESPELRAEYESLKWECDGLPWREYLRRKYEFWNRILGIE